MTVIVCEKEKGFPRLPIEVCKKRCKKKCDKYREIMKTQGELFEEKK